MIELEIKWGRQEYLTKAQIYRRLDLLRELDMLSMSAPPVNAVAVARSIANLTVSLIPFQSRAIGGFLFKSGRRAMLGLNAGRTPAERNFDCAHELIHYFFHPPDIPYACFDRTAHVRQDSFIEYQANEGAAELLVPYRVFIPELCERFHPRRPQGGFADLEPVQSFFTKRFLVSPAVIKYRLRSLAFEINQYLQGVPVERLVILSRRRQLAGGLSALPLPFE